MHRRQFITGASAVWLATEGSEASASPQKTDIQELVDNLAKALSATHGGEWVATTDSKNQFILICRA